jgi:hypothetical protein
MNLSSFLTEINRISVRPDAGAEFEESATGLVAESVRNREPVNGS